MQLHPFYCFAGAFTLPLDMEYLFLVGSNILQLMVVQQRVEVLEFMQDKMSTIKDRNDMDLTEAEDINKRWQEYTEEPYKKELHDLDSHDDVITHLEPDILE